jgi:SAM-dependent methyltransferase
VIGRDFVLRHARLLRLADVARAGLWNARGLARRPGARARIESYLRGPGPRKLQLGAGTTPLPDWLNTDLVPHGEGVVFLDATRPFPIPNETLDYVFSEHQIEHVTLEQGELMLRECFRVLKRGGTLRLATPSLEAMVALSSDTPSDLQRHYIRTVTDQYFPHLDLYEGAVLTNNMLRNWGHRFVYDRRVLRAVLTRAGFVDVAFHAVGESPDPELRGIEGHGTALGDERLNQIETMVAQARKP